MRLIEAENVSKVYRTNVKEPGLKGAVKSLVHSEWKEKAAVDGVSFTMDEGEALACIGENGAGKSTLIKMLVGILTPTSGSLKVYGQNPMAHHKEYLRKIGVLFGQKTNLWIDIPVIESYNAIKVLYKLDAGEFKRNMDMVTDLLDMGPILSSPARKLSLGQRMKADIGMVFLHSPSVLYLDEPTIGLDINIKHSIRQFLRTMNREKAVSIFLTSHDLDDIEQICDNALVLSKGKVYYNGALSDLKARFASKKVINLSGVMNGDIKKVLEDVDVFVDGRKARIEYESTRYTPENVLAAISKCFTIEDISIQEPDIDYVVSKIFQEGGKEAASEKLL